MTLLSFEFLQGRDKNKTLTRKPTSGNKTSQSIRYKNKS